MVALSEAELLAIWEAAAGRPPLARALVLATAAGADPAGIADERIGRRDTYLLSLRERCFGPVYDCVVNCPGCRAELELQLAAEDVRSIEDTGPTTCSADGVEVTFRAVTTRDLLSVVGSADPRRQVITGCVNEPVALSDSGLDVISAAMAAHDPQAAVSIDLDCAICGHRWVAPFDIAGYLWAELSAAAGRIVRDVHALASAYGWSEADVLAVSPLRRRHYLELAAS